MLASEATTQEEISLLLPVYRLQLDIGILWPDAIAAVSLPRFAQLIIELEELRDQMNSIGTGTDGLGLAAGKGTSPAAL